MSGEARIGISAGVVPPVVHSDAMPAKAGSAFHALTPDRVLDAVEAGGLRCTGRCLPLRAFENRVYEVELEDERRLVMKFYRPGRWSRETILDEHRFLQDLAEAELPVVAPLDLGTGQTLNEANGIHYAAFPKVRGRTLDELDAEKRRRMGRTIGRMHAVGRRAPGAASADAGRAVLHPRAARGAAERQVHPGEPGVPLPRRRPAHRRCGAKPLAAARMPSGSTATCTGATSSGLPIPLLVDFDDCMMGPPVQDLWLLASGGTEEARKAREDLIEGYEVFREFDRSTLALAEPLRAMRIVYMSGWIARRWADPSFPPAFPNFRDVRYWMDEYEALVGIAEALV